jgi:hypothetical protein
MGGAVVHRFGVAGEGVVRVAREGPVEAGGGVVGVVEDVVAGATDQDVEAVAARQGVVVGAADEDVVATAAGQPVALLAGTRSYNFTPHPSRTSP